tara:strand:- start:19612 stop:20577 length:966 start_codon:yes stop_codon:yes gene_type:complete
MIYRATLALILPFASPALAEGLQLDLPVDCTLGDTCHIQQYMDRDAGPGVRDYTCAALSYDGHKGTDFALPSLAAMQAGVTVFAAAAGTVKGARDGMADAAPDTQEITNRECGNGVLIDHGNGWETQYCHLKNGSIAVTSGDAVATGTPLGQVGQSGLAAFPHLHLSVRHDGTPVDPFDPDGIITCSAPGDSTLWKTPPAYQPGGLINLGFSDQIPDYAAIKAGTASSSSLPPTAPALVIYGYSYGTLAGDMLRLVLTGPDGVTISKDVRLDKPQAQSFRAIGKKRNAALWPTGTYNGTVTLMRGATVIDEKSATMTVNTP